MLFQLYKKHYLINIIAWAKIYATAVIFILDFLYNMSKKFLIFDLDGALLDSFPDLFDSMCQALDGAKVCANEIRPYVSYGVREMLKKMMSGKSPSEQQVQRTLKYYEESIGENSRLFQDIPALLLQYPFAIVTTKPKHYVKLLCQALPCLGKAEIIIAREDVVHLKPNPEGLLKVCDYKCLKPYQAIYVGDSDVDILAAKACDMPAILVKYGYTPNNVSQNVLDYCQTVENVLELSILLKEML